MKDLFNDIPEAVENTVEIAMRCSLGHDQEMQCFQGFRLMQTQI